jgi:hypothetical protein
MDTTRFLGIRGRPFAAGEVPEAQAGHSVWLAYPLPNTRETSSQPHSEK